MSKLHANEGIKQSSRQLRGTLVEGLADDATGAFSDEDTQLTKFHGFYQQDDRELRNERRRQKLEPLYSFMVRVRLPGGVCTPEQWLTLDRLASDYANGTLRLTTRQTFQFHGILKRDLKAHLQGLDSALLDCIAACGDVNRNVISTANPDRSPAHRRTYKLAGAISQHLLPKTRAYYEIWLDQEQVAGNTPEDEPIYGGTYLPRKFKIALAVPPDNDVDVFAHDLGFIAIVEDGELLGYNVTVGGGMGMSHGEPKTFPRLADMMGFCTPEQVVAVAEQVVCVQRDHGDRSDRKHARLKYTIEDHGLDWFRAEVERRLGFALEPAREFRFETNGDRHGWHKEADGRWHYTLFVENGRIADWPDYPLQTGLREIARVHDGEFALTCNQNLIIAGVAPARKRRIDKLLREHGLTGERAPSALRRASMACVALPTCGLAMAESERYLPELIGKLEAVMQTAGLADDAIVVRMTGCPNGCARPYLAEIGFVGKGPGKYNLYLGGDATGQRLNRPYRENIDEAGILDVLTPLIRDYGAQRETGERFGDYLIRSGAVEPMRFGREFQQ